MGIRRAAVFVADWLEGLTRKAGVWKTLFAFLGAELGLGLPAPPSASSWTRISVPFAPGDLR